jgi:toxin FitB
VIAVDSSVAVAALVSWHEAHEASLRATQEASIPAHALVETYSVLTRLPGRLAAGDAGRLLGLAFGAKRILTPSAGLQRAVVDLCSTVGITGGATYDAYVGLTAREHGARLISRDRKAARVYDLVEVEFELV